MKKKILIGLWIFLFIFCSAMGFIPNVAGAGKVLLWILSVLFFLPGMILLYDAYMQKDRKVLLGIRIVSITSLLLTVIFLVASIAAFNSTAAVGNTLQAILNVVSCPMIISPFWFLSLFLWAFLMCGTFYGKKRQKHR